jgi:hypothetical protein
MRTLTPIAVRAGARKAQGRQRRDALHPDA